MTTRLALDTATEYGSVALGTGDTIAAEVVIGPRRHGAALVPAIQACVRVAGLDIGQVDEIVLADGPGSFTGLRVGFGTVKGVLSEREVPVRTISSLMSAAWAAAPPPGGSVAALYDALRGEVFGALYEFTPAGVVIHAPPHLTTVEALQAAVPVVPRVAVGDGAVKYAAATEAWTGRPPLGPPGYIPRASALLSLAGIPGAAASVDDPTALEPTYGRLAEAQVRWEREHGQSLPDPDRTP